MRILRLAMLLLCVASPAVAMEKLDPDVLTAMAEARRVEGDLDAALALQRTAYAGYEQRAQASPEDFAAQRAAVISLHRVAAVLEEQARLEWALDIHERALAQAQAQAARHAESAAAQGDVGVCRLGLGRVLLRLGRAEEALAANRAAQETFTALALADPADAGARRNLSIAQEAAAQSQRALGHLDEALTAMNAARTLRQALAAAGSPEAVHDLATVDLHLGDLHRARQEPEEALAALERVVAAASAQPPEAQWQTLLAAAESHRGDLHRERGEVDAARVAYERALAAAQALIAEGVSDPTMPVYVQTLERSLAALASEESSAEIPAPVP